MHHYDTFDDFWLAYHDQSLNQHGFYDWQTVAVHHTSDVDYETLLIIGQDYVGSQSMIVTQAHVFDKQHRQYIVKHVTDDIMERFTLYARTSYLESTIHRSGSFAPEAHTAYSEYPSWELFSRAWLDRREGSVYGENMLLLLDHTPQEEYWLRKQTQQKTLPYQRMLVTTFHVATKRFYNFIIRDVDDHEARRIQSLCASSLYLYQDTLFSPNRRAS